jgi:hypothetical protein
MGWMTEGLWFDSHHGQENFLFFKVCRLTLGPTQPDIQWMQNTLYLQVKQPGHAADHLSASSATVKKVCKCNHITIFLHGMVHSWPQVQLYL